MTTKRLLVSLFNYQAALIFVFGTFFVQAMPAQTIQLTDDVARPIPGVGHDYIKLMNETVNPENGSLNIKIDMGAPKSRGITLPFSLTYNSGESHHFATALIASEPLAQAFSQCWTVSGVNVCAAIAAATGSTFNAWCATFSATGCPTSEYTVDYYTDRSESGYGWSDTIPYVAVGYTSEADYTNTGYTAGCPFSNSYNFYGPDGSSHMLWLSAVGDVNVTSGGQVGSPTGPPENDCSILVVNTITRHYEGISQGGDDQVYAEMESSCEGSDSSTEIDCMYASPAFRVTDSAGTSYVFAASEFQANQPPGGRANIGFIFPKYVEDKDGNIANIVQSGTTVTMYDTNGREVVSTLVNTHGVNAQSSGPSSYIVDGLTYSIGYTTATASYTTPTSQVNTVAPIGGTLSELVCPLNKAVADSSSVISSIELPNGQSYTFQYDTTYGVVNKIIYPNGAWVSYEWGFPQNNNELVHFNGLGNGSPVPVNGLDFCQFEASTPVILKRTVGFTSSASPSLIQNFSYTTNWNSSNWAPTWSSKQTTVTTYDAATQRTSQTVYNYAPIAQPANPNNATDITNQLAVESSILYYDWASGSVAGTTLLEKVQKTWADQFVMTSETDTKYTANSSVSKLSTYCYAGGGYAGTGQCTAATAQSYTVGDSYGNFPTRLLETDEYGYDGNLYRVTDYNYYTLYEPCFFTTNIGNILKAAPSSCASSSMTSYHNQHSPAIACQITTYDGSLNKVAETDAYFDGNTSLCSGKSAVVNTAVTAGLPSGPSSGFGTFDTSNYGTGGYTATAYAPYLTRGDLTELVKWSNTGANVINTLTYDVTGQVLSRTDGCGNGTCSDMIGSSHTVYYAYADMPTGGNSAGNSNAFITKITYPTVNGVTPTENFTYNYSTSELASAQDENSQTTTYSYSDPLYRLTGITYPVGGGSVSYVYNDSVPSVTSVQTENSSGLTKTTINTFDGMGHVIETETTGSANDDTLFVDTTYDGLGHAWKKTNPYRGSSGAPTSATTNGTTTTYLDALGRPIETIQPDGNILQTCYNGLPSYPAASNCSSQELGSSASTNFTGTWVDASDESGNHWQRVTDAFGRLVRVMEPNGTSHTPTMETDYTYDASNNLLKVAQWGGPSGSSVGTRSRSFAYDSLSRLICASNPESSRAACPVSSSSSWVTGTTGYTYDGNGNVAQKTDARGVTTTYLYDALNRVFSKSYSDGLTPASCYQYDGSQTLNEVGRLVAAWTMPAGNTCASVAPASGFVSMKLISGGYDPMGRIQGTQQKTCIGSTCTTAYQVGLTYDLVGNITTLSNSVGANGALLTLNNTFDSANRHCLTTSSWTINSTVSPNLFQVNPSTTTPGYAAFGGLQNWSLGSSLTAAASGCASTPSSAINLQQQFDTRFRTTTITSSGLVP